VGGLRRLHEAVGCYRSAGRLWTGRSRHSGRARRRIRWLLQIPVLAGVLLRPDRYAWTVLCVCEPRGPPARAPSYEQRTSTDLLVAVGLQIEHRGVANETLRRRPSTVRRWMRPGETWLRWTQAVGCSICNVGKRFHPASRGALFPLQRDCDRRRRRYTSRGFLLAAWLHGGLVQRCTTTSSTHRHRRRRRHPHDQHSTWTDTRAAQKFQTIHGQI
jgi:hypothetical protein